MSVTTLPAEDQFAATPLRGLPDASRVNREKRLITGARAMQLGALNAGDARPWKVDMTTLQQVERYVNASGRGVKMRFAHPNMSNDGMGRQLGRAANARIVEPEDGDAYLAIDARLGEYAKRSPNGNLAEHVLDIAEEDPEVFGLSPHLMIDHEAMGKIEPDEQGLRPIRLKGLRAIDVVDDPASTRGGMFSLESDSLVDLPARATDLLDTFFADSPADVIRARFGSFLETYLRNRGDDDMSTDAKPTAELEAAKQENEQLKTQVADLAKQVETLTANLKLEPVDTAAEKAKAELERISEVTALCSLAKVDDQVKKLILDSKMPRTDAQAWLKDNSHLSAKNPPVSEGGNDPGGKPQTDEEKFAAEYAKDAAMFGRMGLTKDEYVKSRLQDAA